MRANYGLVGYPSWWSLLLEINVQSSHWLGLRSRYNGSTVTNIYYICYESFRG